MKPIKVLGPVVVGLALMAALAASAAALTPEFWSKGIAISAPVKFEGKSTAVVLETKNFKIECSSSTKFGETSGATKLVKLVYKLQGCKEAGGLGGACKTHSHAAGEIVTEFVKARLGGLKTTPTKEVGLLLQNEAGGTGFVLEFECALITGTIHDEAIGQITPILKESPEFKLGFECKSAGSGVQGLVDFEGESEPHNFVFFYPSLEKEDLCIKMNDVNKWLPAGKELEVHA
jgi:hypothetical protein